MWSIEYLLSWQSKCPSLISTCKKKFHRFFFPIWSFCLPSNKFLLTSVLERHVIDSDESPYALEHENKINQWVSWFLKIDWGKDILHLRIVALFVIKAHNCFGTSLSFVTVIFNLQVIFNIHVIFNLQLIIIQTNFWCILCARAMIFSYIAAVAGHSRLTICINGTLSMILTECVPWKLSSFWTHNVANVFCACDIFRNATIISICHAKISITSTWASMPQFNSLTIFVAFIITVTVICYFEFFSSFNSTNVYVFFGIYRKIGTLIVLFSIKSERKFTVCVWVSLIIRPCFALLDIISWNESKFEC